jgi:hypothetical protein
MKKAEGRSAQKKYAAPLHCGISRHRRPLASLRHASLTAAPSLTAARPVTPAKAGASLCLMARKTKTKNFINQILDSPDTEVICLFGPSIHGLTQYEARKKRAH